MGNMIRDGADQWSDLLIVINPKTNISEPGSDFNNKVHSAKP